MQHQHAYDFARSSWQCLTEDTDSDFCTEDDAEETP